MANNKLLVDERQTEIGNFMVGRLLPFRKKRQVGHFTFIDHMGPNTLGNGHFMDVDQHPHTGLSTLSYLLEGEIEHRDSLGSVQLIKAGDVAFMTAGKAISHTERTPDYLRKKQSFVMHGYQIWVALPRHLENMDPRFDYYPASQIESWKQDNLELKLLAGKAFGKSAELQGYSPLFMVDIKAVEESVLNLAGKIKGEVAFVIVKGAIKSENEKVEAGQMLISKTEDECEIKLEAKTQILIFGGEKLEYEPLLMWNFVSYSKEGLLKAKQNWIDKKFPKVPGDESYIAFPERR